MFIYLFITGLAISIHFIQYLRLRYYASYHLLKIIMPTCTYFETLSSKNYTTLYLQYQLQTDYVILRRYFSTLVSVPR